MIIVYTLTLSFMSLTCMGLVFNVCFLRYAYCMLGFGFTSGGNLCHMSFSVTHVLQQSNSKYLSVSNEADVKAFMHV